MACTSPLTAYKPLSGGPLAWREKKDHREIQIACGQCASCRLKRRATWALRLIHESQLHTENVWITVTYDDDHLPEHNSLRKPDLQRFYKRLRKHIGPFRYYGCGEYGDLSDRPHYHAILFGIDFHDKIQYRKVGDHWLYTSATLNTIWGLGTNNTIGSVTFDTAAYTAGYLQKKLSKGQTKYVRLDETTGELIPLVQPFATMSLRPAIGRNWLEKYHADIYGADKDSVHIAGKLFRPARYYDKLYEQINPDRLEWLKKQRADKAKPETEQQLHARDRVTRARMKTRSQI